jgi:hypothetical protein
MIRHQTVFVLGAGASYPYGFPTGEGLVNERSKRRRVGGTAKSAGYHLLRGRDRGCQDDSRGLT